EAVTPILIKSRPAAADIAPFRIAAFTGDRQAVETAAAATDRLAGVTGSMGATEGGVADLMLVGEGEVQAGAAFEAGDPLTSDAEGRAIKAVAVAGSTVFVIGTAQDEASAAGDIVPFLGSPSVIVTPAA